jgi:hypothetical protein
MPIWVRPKQAQPLKVEKNLAKERERENKWPELLELI